MWTSLCLRFPAAPSTFQSLFRPATTGVIAFPSLLSGRLMVPALPLGLHYHQSRHGSNLAPRHSKYRKAHKGRVPVRTGGSTKGTTVIFGEYGLRIKDGARLSAVQLTAAHNAIKRKIKPVKGSDSWLRVFPDVPVTSKGNEVRMGKGKGTFEYWACRVPANCIVFEVGGLRKEIAKEALRLGGHKLPVKTEMVEKGDAPVVGAGYVGPLIRAKEMNVEAAVVGTEVVEGSNDLVASL